MAVLTSETNDSEILLTEIWHILKSQKRLIGAVTGTTTMLALLFAIFSTPQYRAEILLAPIDDSGNLSSTMANLADQFGGLLSLSGRSLGTGGSQTYALPQLTSRRFTEQFLLDENILPHLFEKQWDPGSNSWLPRKKGLLFPVKEFIAYLSDDRGFDRLQQRGPGPTMEQAIKLFHKIRAVEQNPETGLITLSIEWPDPVLAAEWTRKLVDRINKTIRGEVIADAKESIQYLKEQVSTTSDTGLTRSIYSLIEAQTKIIMLASVTDRYAFRVIDPAVVPDRPSRPKRAFVVIFGMLAGLGFGILWVLARNAFRVRQNQ